MKARLLVTPFAAAAVVIAMAMPASATHAWADYHWARTSNPFELVINESLTSDWLARTAAVASDWTTTTGSAGQTAPFSLTLRSSATDNSTRKRCPAVTGQLRVCNASYGNNGWLGLAQIWIDANHHIVKGFEKLNDYYFNSSTYPYNNEAERRHVACQEIGHTFGLDHQDESGASLNTCMDYYHNTSSSDTQSTRPNTHDIDQLTLMYSHNDSYNSSNTSTSNSSHGNPSVSRDGKYTVLTWTIAA